MLRVTAAVLIIGLGGWYGYARMSDGEEAEFTKRYLAMASANPDDLQRHFAAVIPDCLPQTSRVHLKTQRVKDLTTLTFMKSATLTAEGKSPEEASSVLIPYLIKLGEQMPEDDQQSYIAIVNNGGLQGRTLVCVVLALKTSIYQSDVGGDAEKWQLRR